MTIENWNKGKELLDKFKLLIKEHDRLTYIINNLLTDVENGRNTNCILYIFYDSDDEESHVGSYELETKSLLDITCKVRKAKQEELEKVREEFYKL